MNLNNWITISFISFITFFAIYSTTDLQISDPLIWRETPHGVSNGTNYYTLIIEMENPCYSVGYLTKGDRRECENEYQRMMNLPIIQNCHPVKKVELLNPTHPHHLSLKPRREKRFLPTVGAIGVGVILATSVIGWASSMIFSKHAYNQVRQLEIEVQHDMEAVKTKALIDIKLEKKMEEQLQKFAQVINQMKEDFQREVHSSKITQKLVGHFEVVEPILRKFLIGAKSGTVGDDFSYLFPGINLCPSCHKRFWEFEGCEYLFRKNKTNPVLLLKLLAPVILDEYSILQAIPFSFIKETGDQVCHYQYVGNRYSLYNKLHQCTRSIHIHPMQSKWQSFYIYHPDECQRMDPEIKHAWKKTNCRSIKSFNIADPTNIQIEIDKFFTYIYCYNQTLKSVARTVKCGNNVYKLPRNQEFTINKQHYDITKFTLRGDMTSIEPSLTSMINSQIFSGISNYTPDFKELDLLLKEEERLINDIGRPLINVNDYPWIIIGIFLFFLTVCLLFHSKLRSICCHKQIINEPTVRFVARPKITTIPSLRNSICPDLEINN